MATTATQLPFNQLDGIAGAARCIAQALRSRKDVAVLLVWLTGIERLYASVGHLEATRIVDAFQDSLAGVCRDGDSIHRISDCKSAVLLTGLKNRGHVTLAAKKLERVAQKAGAQNGSAFQLGTTIGVALAPDQGNEPHELLRKAEVACLDARRRNYSPLFFEQESAAELFEEWDLESRLRDALDAGDLELHLQPKTLIRSGEIVAAETLSRWHDSDLGPISPQVFVDLAESSGQIFDLTQFAVQTACRFLSEWCAELPHLKLAVNISPSLIKTHEIIDLLRGATNIWGVAPQRLTLEITETALMDDLDVSHEVLAAIRDFGCEVSIDDFGTGYSSLAYLKEIPADELKIDRSFVMGMLDDPGDRKIVEHAINIAKSFDLSVVAEGIESEEALVALRRLDCDFAQGYYISKPLAADAFLQFCRAYRA